MKNRALRILLVAILIGASFAGGAAQAQGFPGGRGQDRGANRHSPGNGDPADAAKRNAAATNPVLSEPAIAIERELPSLRNELLLEVAQVDAWTVFERSVREAAQAARARTGAFWSNASPQPWAASTCLPARRSPSCKT